MTCECRKFELCIGRDDCKRQDRRFDAPIKMDYAIQYTKSTPQFRALAAIVTERHFQDTKHGHPDDNPHSLGAWALVLRKELEEFETAIIKGGRDRDNAIHELIQVAAVAVAALEQWGVEPIEGRCL